MALTILKEADFRKALKTAPTGGYLFFGEEDYMKSASLRMARQGITEADPAMATFNDIRLDGLDFTHCISGHSEVKTRAHQLASLKEVL